MTDLETILSWFQTGDMPTEEEFQETFSSFRLKNTKIPIAEVDKLESLLNDKINANDYIKDGKIRADKIEALGLTELIESTEQDISEFAENSDKYEFQQNDFIAIPDDKGNFSLYIFKGGEKKDRSKYLPTGLTNITISMVEGLQNALNTKLDKPTANGNYFLNMMDGNPTYQSINLSSNHLLFWDGSNFKNSNIFSESSGLKYGVGTNIPTEQLHLTDRARMKALVLDENSENLVGQITRTGNRFSGTNSAAIKRGFQYNDYEDFLNSFSSFSKDQNLALANILGGGTGSPGNPSVNLISPPIIQNQYDVNEYVLLQGANLYLGSSSKIEILAADKASVIAEIPNNQVQQYGDGLSLIFYYNFSSFTEGQYFIRLISGAKIYITSLDLKIVQNVENIDTNSIMWDFLYSQDIPVDTEDTQFGPRVNYLEPLGYSSNPKKSIKSSELFQAGDDFYIELNIDFGSRSHDIDCIISTIGLGYSSTTNTNNFNSLVNFGYSCTGSYQDAFYLNFERTGLESPYPSKQTIIIIKTGNLFRIVHASKSRSLILSNDSGYSLFINVVGRRVQALKSIYITKAFKFN